MPALQEIQTAIQSCENPRWAEQRLAALTAHTGDAAEACRQIMTWAADRIDNPQSGFWSQRVEAEHPALTGNYWLYRRLMGMMQENHQQLQDVWSALDSLTPEERRPLFEAAFPQLGRHIEQAWRMFLSLPFYRVDTCNGFRAPHNPAINGPLRAHWLIILPWILKPFDRDITWFAEHAAYLKFPYELRESADFYLGVLLAAAIDGGGEEGERVFQILRESAEGTHPVGAMGNHVIRALLGCSRPEAWEVIVRLLLDAGLQEGLRQAIMKRASFASRGALRRLVQAIGEHDLLRFPAVRSAIEIWFNLTLKFSDTADAAQFFQRLLALWDDPEARRATLTGTDQLDLAMALWVEAVHDVEPAITLGARLLESPELWRRAAGLFHLRRLQLDEALRAMAPALDDEDLRLASFALDHISKVPPFLDDAGRRNLFQRLMRLYARLPKREQSLQPVIWGIFGEVACRNDIFSPLITYAIDPDEIQTVTSYLNAMDSNARYHLAERLRETRVEDRPANPMLYRLLGDASSYVRKEALLGLNEAAAAQLDAALLEELLERKSRDVRAGVLELLLKLDDEAVLASARRLLASRKGEPRQGGLELLSAMVTANRHRDECVALVQEWLAATQTPAKAELKLAGETLRYAPEPPAGSTAEPTMENALGLIDPEDRTRPEPPQPRPVCLDFTAAMACIDSLAAFIKEHAGARYSFTHYYDNCDETLSLTSSFPTPEWTDDYLDKHYQGDRPPLRPLWEEWLATRPAETRDPDGLELCRAWFLLHWESAYDIEKNWKFPYIQELSHRIFPGFTPNRSRPAILRSVLDWLLWLSPEARNVDFMLDLYETILTMVPREIIDAARPPQSINEHGIPISCAWPEADPIKACESRLRQLRKRSGAWSPEHDGRLWRLQHWINYPVTQRPEDGAWQSHPWHLVTEWGQQDHPCKFYPDIESLAGAFTAGAANEADLLEQLLRNERWLDGKFFEEHHSGLIKRHPFLMELNNRLREQVLEAEFACRQPGLTAEAVLALEYVYGIRTLIRAVQALGQSGFLRNYCRLDSEDKNSIYCHIIQASLPTPGETGAQLIDAARQAGLDDQRLVDLAFYTPHWAGLIEQGLGLDGLEEAVYWFFAHLQGDSSWRLSHDRDRLRKVIQDATPLTAEDLAEGGVDVAWFRRIHARLGAAGWAKVDAAAKNIANGGGQKRAQLYANTILGKADRVKLIAQVRDKRDKDSARALGLLPLTPGEGREDDLMERYELLQELLRTSKNFGAQRRQSEKRAVEMALDSLAVTAGFRDPHHLTWTMEGRAMADVAGGGLTVTVDGVTVSLVIDDLGQPELGAARDGAPLKAIPPAVKKHPEVNALVGRQSELKKQVGRMRRSLEEAMTRGDTFSGRDLQALAGHPTLRPMLGDLVFTGEGLMGYPVRDGAALEDETGAVTDVPAEALLRIAHPLDLLASGRWPAWQRECLTRERIQPFKQVFRELYVLTDTERKEKEGYTSRRYANQRLTPRQALGALGGRGWAHEHLYDEEASLRRPFHEAGLAARLVFSESFHNTGEVNEVTIDHLEFVDRLGWSEWELAKVPPIIFSEVMRDIDLAVSVAQAGNPAFEASAPCLESRAALVRETAAVLGLSGVHIDGNQVIIPGTLAGYAVHLGSGQARLLSGGALVIKPAGGSGRIFLPFADEDPKTAEVLSKVLLLAQDDKLKDPSILKQIRDLAG